MPRRRRLSWGVLSALLALAMVGVAPVSAARPNPSRTIQFSGGTWLVKQSAGKTGPGPCQFSNSLSSVWVDIDGRLHLRINGSGRKWTCAEVILQQSLGYGSYRFHIDSRVDTLDPNVVLGLFTWNDDPAYAHREIDGEFAKWGNPADPTNAQYVVQPWDATGHQVRWTQPAVEQSILGFDWQPTRVDFRTVAGTDWATGSPISTWSFTDASAVPVAGGENPRINLWLFQGAAPMNGQPVEVIISRFEHVAP
ncbi:MAG TPA: hypothetical protein VFK38_00270 [Candidatus Limnocylindrales bacterium]|nr:hypothetical protein [Candidatus Limnocylindrales bacterium]